MINVQFSKDPLTPREALREPPTWSGAVLRPVGLWPRTPIPTAPFDRWGAPARPLGMPLSGLGSVAPDFELRDQRGVVRRLSELVQAGPVVLFFYPKDETAVCKKEACGFRDHHSEFAALRASVFGISQDSVESHASFAENHHLPYSLLVDPQGRVAASFGIKKVLGLLPGRATFVVDRERKVRLAFSSTLDAQAHVRRALSAVRSLS